MNSLTRRRRKMEDFIPDPANLFDIGREDALEFTEIGFDLFTGIAESEQPRRPKERATDERFARLQAGEAPLNQFEKQMFKNRRDLFGRELRFDA